jgi:hypothetical protein
MSKIENINLNKTVYYSDERIDYFICDGDETQLVDYSYIINKIKNAKKIINIASTSKISDDIIDALYQNDAINLYMIVKSFESAKATLQRFDSKKPTVIREVESLENNFIIIDDISYLFVNPLSNKTNISIEYDEKYTKDLSFIFQSYFWDYAIKEKLVDTISDPVESPYPPIGKRDLEYVNTVSATLDNCTALYIPKNKKFIEILEQESENKFFSDDIQISVYMNKEYMQIGKLKFSVLEFDFTNRWRLKNDSLKDIGLEDEIIPKNDDWNQTISISESKDINLGSVVSDTIEKMENTQPKEFIGKPYTQSINYNWDVLPPSKPDDAKKSSLYNEYDKLNNDYQEQLKQLEHQLSDLEKESGLLNQWFGGANRKAKQNLKKIEEYKVKDVTKLNIVDLDNFLSKEFKCFYEDIVKSDKDFKSEKKRKEVESKWTEEKGKIENSLTKKINELKDSKNRLAELTKITQKKKELKSQIVELKNSIKSLQSKDETYDVSEKSRELKALENKEKELKDNPKEQTKLEKSIKNQTNEIQRIEEEIKEKYTNFKYTPKENEIKNTQKSNEKVYKQLKLPKYSLPEVGALYETQKEYFLEIVDDADLDKANKLKQRYEDKEYKVVVGDNGE